MSKLLLTSSSNYSSTKAWKSKKISFDELTSEYEYWRSNRSKNKTGFGIPKYHKIEKYFWKFGNIKRIRPHELVQRIYNKKYWKAILLYWISEWKLEIFKSDFCLETQTNLFQSIENYTL